MTVYILQEMGRNVRSAEKFGDLKVVLPDNRQIVLSSGPLTFKLQQELKNFNDEDYLLLMGDPAIIAVAGAVVSDVNGGRFKVLKWDRDEKRYYDIEIDLRGKRNE
jgi:folate-dependent tRNA-U54 methylase TrmFO/GidA|tara:strand:- start:902 stop:1219 length:318 start_codon:yes stop_codon:yes gene_type:complete